MILQSRYRPVSLWMLLPAVCLLGCYAPFIAGMIRQWWNDDDMGHGFAVLPIIVWASWNQLRRARREQDFEPAPRSGLAILCLGAFLHFAATLGAGLFAGCLALVVSTAGAVIWLGGFAALRLLAFPFVLSLFLLPKLAIVYNQVTLPLQLLASRLAALLLTLTGAGVIRDGNILQVHGSVVAVEEACSGIRYLLPLGFLALTYGYLVNARIWIRVALAAAVIPLAVITNAVRVALAASDPALVGGLAHQLIGLAGFAACLSGLVTTHWLLNRVSRKLSHAG
jgi:exosortase